MAFCDNAKPTCVSEYRKVLFQLSENLTKEEIEKLKHLSADFIPIAFLEKISSGLQLFSAFERAALIKEGKLDVLVELLREIGREELVDRVYGYLLGSTEQANETGQCKTGKETKNTNLISNGPLALHNPESKTYSDEPLVLSRQEHCTESVIDGSPVKVINFLEFEGYIVEIIGGKHFSTPQGEFVELRNGCQYKIHAVNTHAETCNLDVFIDGNDVGGWVLNGKEEITIERPVQEVGKFTFYRVKLAPKDSGIESGRNENGLVRCVFTPEKTLVVLLNPEGSSERIEVNVSPQKSLGYLKIKMQEQLKLPVDPGQLLVLDGKLHKENNSTNLRDVFEDCDEHDARLVPNKLVVQVKYRRSSFEILIDPRTATVGDIRQKIAVTLGTVSMMTTIRIWQGGSLSTTLNDPLPEVLVFQQHPCLVVESSDQDIFQDDINIVVKLLEENIVLDVSQNVTIADLAKSLQSTLPVHQQNLMKDSRIVFCHKGVKLDPLIHKEPLRFLPIVDEDVLSAKIESCRVKVKLKMPDACEFTAYVSLSGTLSDLAHQVPRQYKLGRSPRVLFLLNGKLLDPAKDREVLGAYGLQNYMIVTVLIGVNQELSSSSVDTWSEDDDVWSDTELNDKCYRGKPEMKSSREDSPKGAVSAKTSEETFLKRVKKKVKRPLNALKSAAGLGQKVRERGVSPTTRGSSRQHSLMREEEVWTSTSERFDAERTSNASRSVRSRRPRQPAVSAPSPNTPPPSPPPLQPARYKLRLGTLVKRETGSTHAVTQGRYVSPVELQGRHSPEFEAQGPSVKLQERHSPEYVSQGCYSLPVELQGRHSPEFEAQSLPVVQGRYSPPVEIPPPPPPLLPSARGKLPPPPHIGSQPPQLPLPMGQPPTVEYQQPRRVPPGGQRVTAIHSGIVTHEQIGALMESICAGTTLKKIEDKYPPNKHNIPGGTLAQALERALMTRETTGTQKKRVRVRVVEEKDKESRKAQAAVSETKRFVKDDPAWRAGATTLQGTSEQQFTPALSVRGDSARTVLLIMRLVARDDEELGLTPSGECKPLSTLSPPTVQD